jgi:hypothetical protein
MIFRYAIEAYVSSNGEKNYFLHALGFGFNNGA